MPKKSIKKTRPPAYRKRKGSTKAHRHAPAELVDQQVINELGKHNASVVHAWASRSAERPEGRKW
jgi:hypothetical protein